MARITVEMGEFRACGERDSLYTERLSDCVAFAVSTPREAGLWHAIGGATSYVDQRTSAALLSLSKMPLAQLIIAYGGTQSVGTGRGLVRAQDFVAELIRRVGGIGATAGLYTPSRVTECSTTAIEVFPNGRFRTSGRLLSNALTSGVIGIRGPQPACMSSGEAVLAAYKGSRKFPPRL